MSQDLLCKFKQSTNLISDERGQETKDGVDLVRGRDECLVLESVLSDENGESFTTVKVEQLEQRSKVCQAEHGQDVVEVVDGNLQEFL